MRPENQRFQIKSFSGAQSSVPTACFRSFWRGGFEGADHRNGSGESLDPAVATGLSPLERDYSQLARIGIRTVRKRYQRWIVAETSHVGRGRATWFDQVAGEVFRARKRGLPSERFCQYSTLDRCDWESAASWHNSGRWDVVDDAFRSPDLSRKEQQHVSRRRVLTCLTHERCDGGNVDSQPACYRSKQQHQQQRKLVCKH